MAAPLRGGGAGRADRRGAEPIGITPSPVCPHLARRRAARRVPTGQRHPPSARNGPTAPPSDVAVAGGPALVAPPVDGGCLTTSQLTLEASDTAAVGTFSEPRFSGATGALVDVQIGELGDTRGSAGDLGHGPGRGGRRDRRRPVLRRRGRPGRPFPARAWSSWATRDPRRMHWGPARPLLSRCWGATDGCSLTTDSASATPPRPRLARRVHCHHREGPDRPTPRPPPPRWPRLSRRASDVQRHLCSAPGGCRGSPVEAIPTLSSGGLVTVDRVVFTSPISAVAEYHFDLSPGQSADRCTPPPP